MRLAAVILVALAAAAGCGSTVLLGSLPGFASTDMAETFDMARPIPFDLADGALPGDLFDGGVPDLSPAIDLAP